MPVERSAGFIIFRSVPEGRKYLVLRSSRSDQSRSEFWDIPKGVLERGEKGIDTALREAAEEAGIKNPKVEEGFKETLRYFTKREGNTIPKFVAVFLASVEGETITLSEEHDCYLWLSYEEARTRVTLVPLKKALDSAEAFLNSDRAL